MYHSRHIDLGRIWLCQQGQGHRIQTFEVLFEYLNVQCLFSMCLQNCGTFLWPNLVCWQYIVSVFLAKSLGLFIKVKVKMTICPVLFFPFFFSQCNCHVWLGVKIKVPYLFKAFHSNLCTLQENSAPVTPICSLEPQHEPSISIYIYALLLFITLSQRPELCWWL